MEAAQHYNNNSNCSSADDKNDDDDKDDQRASSASHCDANSDAFRSSSIAALRARAQQHSEKLQLQQHHQTMTQDLWNSVARLSNHHHN
jgi:hypothetical protein